MHEITNETNRYVLNMLPRSDNLPPSTIILNERELFLFNLNESAYSIKIT